MGKTSSQVKNRWNAAHYQRLVVSLPIEDAQAYRRKCEEKGFNLSKVMKDAIYKFLEEER